jgi:uncharacterized protein YjbJ (UPF0337 family)
MSIGNRIKGAAEELGGKAKEALGKLTDDERLRSEGIEDQGTGQGRQDVAKADEQVEGFGEQVKGRVKGAVGALTGDDSTEASGKLDDIKGSIRRKLNE